MKECPNCGSKLTGLLNTNTLKTENFTKELNEKFGLKNSHYCNNCSSPLIKKLTAAARQESIKNKQDKEHNKKRINKLINYIPILTTHSPHAWNYKSIGMVTGQSSTGTGVITEFASTFTDLVGASSGRHNEKLKTGEDICKRQLRMQCFLRGGNAVIATDIDYSEIGSGKGILMVCMAGTAVDLIDLTVLSDKVSNNLLELSELREYAN